MCRNGPTGRRCLRQRCRPIWPAHLRPPTWFDSPSLKELQRMSKCFALTVALCCAQLPLAAQTTDSIRYQLTSVMVPMRDGVRLNTHIYAPQGQKDPLPFLMTRTPYGIEGDSMALKEI